MMTERLRRFWNSPRPRIYLAFIAAGLALVGFLKGDVVLGVLGLLVAAGSFLAYKYLP